MNGSIQKACKPPHSGKKPTKRTCGRASGGSGARCLRAEGSASCSARGTPSLLSSASPKISAKPSSSAGCRKSTNLKACSEAMASSSSNSGSTCRPARWRNNSPEMKRTTSRSYASRLIRNVSHVTSINFCVLHKPPFVQLTTLKIPGMSLKLPTVTTAI